MYEVYSSQYEILTGRRSRKILSFTSSASSITAGLKELYNRLVAEWGESNVSLLKRSVKLIVGVVEITYTMKRM